MPRQFTLDHFKAKDDVYLEPDVGLETDIVIPIMGPTGVGKSTFVNNVLGREEAQVSDGFKSCTRQLAHYFIEPHQLAGKLKPVGGSKVGDQSEPEEGLNVEGKLAGELEIENRRIVLVDTPGFDDTEISDSEILRRIAVWLASSYSSKMTVGGVVYMYPIYPNRMTRNDRSNIKVFQKICGEDGLSKVILTTTRWDICPAESGEKRKKELTNTFWSDMLPGSDSEEMTKAGMTELWNNQKSAWDLIGYVLKRRADSDIDGVILTIQKQIVDKSKKLKHTDAAQALRQKLQELLKESGVAATQTRREKLRALASEIAALRLPLSTRIMRFFGRTS